jgi:hypothetical protein
LTGYAPAGNNRYITSTKRRETKSMDENQTPVTDPATDDATTGASAPVDAPEASDAPEAPAEGGEEKPEGEEEAA